MAKLDNKQGREVFGTGGSLNTHHEGPMKRPTEARSNLDDWQPAPEKRKSRLDLLREKWERERQERAAKKAEQEASKGENLG